MRVTIIDTETTGKIEDWSKPSTDPDHPHIASIALATFVDKTLVYANSALISPAMAPTPWEMPPDAEAINGLSTETLKRHGFAIRGQLDAVWSEIRYADEVVMFNKSFDMRMFRIEALRAGPVCGDLADWCKNGKAFCCMLEGRKRLVMGGKFPNLDDIYFECFGEKRHGQHQALHDVIDTARVYFHLKTLPVPPTR